MQLIVLGMHRSGTSVLARILNLMGAYFGPEGSSIGANPENPKGFWERRDVRQLNDFVLHAAGHDWNRVAGFSVSKIPSEALNSFDKKAGALILDMDAHRPWFIKEPRLCLLLPIWRKHLDLPLCIHIYRHPEEVASSMNKRNGIPRAAGLALWETYVRSAWAASIDLPRIIVSHRDLMQNPHQEVVNLWRTLQDFGVPSLRKPQPREIDAFVDPKLHRERADAKPAHGRRPVEQIALYEELIGKTVPHKLGRSLSSKAKKSLAAYEDSLPPFEAPIERTLKTANNQPPDEQTKVLSERVLVLKTGIEERDVRIGQLKAKAAETDQRIVDMTRQLRALRLECDAAKIRNKSLDDERLLLVEQTKRSKELMSVFAEEASAMKKRIDELIADQAELLSMKDEISALRASEKRLVSRELALEIALRERMNEINQLLDAVGTVYSANQT